MANKFQVKRTTVSGRTPNTTNSSNSRYIDTGELALNVPDGKLYSSNGTGYFEIGANLQNLSVAANTVIYKLVANGSLGQNTQVLASNGTSTYWADAAVGELVLTGTDLVTDVFTGNGTNTQFTLSTTPYDESAVTVIIDGVSQHKSAYSVSGNLIIFSSAPSLDAEVDVTCYTTAGNRLMGVDVTVDTFVGNGSNTEYSLSVTPDNESQILVVIDGVSQHKSAYSLSSHFLTFSSAPSVDAEIDVTVFATGPVGAGSNTQVMFNDAGAFAGTDSFTFNKTTNTVSISTISISGGLYANGSRGTSDQVLTSNGTTGSPYWGTITSTPGPAFSAYADAQTSLLSGTPTKVLFAVEEFDTNSNFASSRFTPTVEGYYQLNSTVRIVGASGTDTKLISIYKNGVDYKRGWDNLGVALSGTDNFWSMSVSTLVYSNGTTDYFEVYVMQTSASTRTTAANSNLTWFNGVMLRGA